jgi:hypothetical protein
MSHQDSAEQYPTDSKNTALLGAISMVIGLVGTLLIAEIVLRFLPVAGVPRILPVNAQNPLLRYALDRRYTWSVGWDFGVTNRGRTNNYGFVNDQDYDANAHTPLLGVIGDSYVEALLVPYAETVHGRLAGLVGEQGRVYSFGMSGAALSQYLAEAEFARVTFRPSALVIVIVGNDFDESLPRYKSPTGFHYFEESGGQLRLARMDYSPSRLRSVVRWFAVARYLVYNLRLPQGIASVKARFSEPAARPGQFVGNTAGAPDSQRLADSRRVVDEFLAELPARSGLDPSRIVLVVDGMRTNLYSAEGLKAARGSYFDVMRGYLMSRAAPRGFEVIDMQPRFIERYRRDSVRYEFPTDGHWNAVGHEEAAVAVARSTVFKETFGATTPMVRSRSSQHHDDRHGAGHYLR